MRLIAQPNAAAFLQRLSLPLAFAAIAACSDDARALKGEPLVVTNARAELEPGIDSTSLRPAVAFISAYEYGMRLVDPGLEGQFPNQFGFSLDEAPPDEAFISRAGTKDWVAWGVEDPAADLPDYAMGFLTAVPDNHPSVVPLVWAEDVASDQASSGVAAVPTTTGSPATCPPEGCRSEIHACIGGGAQCYVETRSCELPDQGLDECQTIDRKGDPSLFNRTWETVRGMSREHLVVYFDAPIPLDDELSVTFGFTAPASAGYHLIEMREPNAEEAALIAGCNASVKQLAADRFNKLWGTSRTVAELEEPGAFFAGMTQTSEPPKTYDQLLHEARVQTRCSELESVVRPLEGAAASSIVVHLGQPFATML